VTGGARPAGTPRREGLTRLARLRLRRGGGAAALIPVKRLEEAKSRLAPVLSPEARARLQLAMLADMLERLAGTKGLRRLLVLTDDAEAAALARAADAEVLADPSPQDGLNAALAAGLASLRGRDAAGVVAILPADLAFLDGAEVAAGIARAARRGRAQVVPDRHGLGTNALFLPPGCPLVPQFGPGSLARHLAAGEALALASLACDIDLPVDLDLARAALAGCGGPSLPPGETAIALSAWCRPDRRAA